MIRWFFIVWKGWKYLDFIKEKCMLIEYEIYFFNEVIYFVDYLKVKVLMMILKNKKDIKCIVIYLRGGKG